MNPWALGFAAASALGCDAILGLNSVDYSATTGTGTGTGGAASASSSATSSASSTTGSGGSTSGTGGSSTSGTGGSTGGTGGTGGASTGGADAGPPAPVCGDGQKEGAEECDDGNTVPGDRCGPTCKVEDPTTCPGTPIALGLTPIVIVDDTTGASDKAVGSTSVGNCMDGNWQGSDLVYAVTPTQSGMLTATLQTSYPSRFLHVRPQCPGSKGNELACNYGSNAGTSTVTLAVSAGTTLYMFADSYANTDGTFTLTLSLAP